MFPHHWYSVSYLHTYSLLIEPHMVYKDSSRVVLWSLHTHFYISSSLVPCFTMFLTWHFPLPAFIPFILYLEADWDIWSRSNFRWDLDHLHFKKHSCQRCIDQPATLNRFCDFLSCDVRLPPPGVRVHTHLIFWLLLSYLFVCYVCLSFLLIVLLYSRRSDLWLLYFFIMHTDMCTVQCRPQWLTMCWSYLCEPVRWINSCNRKHIADLNNMIMIML